MPRHAMPRRTSHATPSCHHAMSCRAPCHTSHAMPCHAAPCRAMPLIIPSWCVVLAGPRLTAHDCLPCRYSEDALRTRGEEALRPADRAAVQVRKLQSPLNARFGALLVNLRNCMPCACTHWSYLHTGWAVSRQ